jgi:hypothetical protein
MHPSRTQDILYRYLYHLVSLEKILSLKELARANAHQSKNGPINILVSYFTRNMYSAQKLPQKYCLARFRETMQKASC